MITKTPQEFAEDNAHVPTETIKKDIADTEAEIVHMEQEEKHLRNTPPSLKTRMVHLRRSSIKEGIKDRKEFVKDLKVILAEREK